MPLRVDVTDNSYAQRVYDELRAREEGLQPNVPAAGQQQAGVPADGLLTRTLQDICRKGGAESASRLQNAYVAKTVNLNLDHSDEVDGGKSTSRMDDDWVDVEYVSDLLKGPEKEAESADQTAQRAMAQLENLSVDDIFAAYGDLASGNDLDDGGGRLREAMAKGEGGEVGEKITAAIKAQEKLGEKLSTVGDELREAGNEAGAAEAGTLAVRANACARCLKELVVRIVQSKEDVVKEQGVVGRKVADLLSHEMLPSDEWRKERESTEKAVRIIDEGLTGLEAAYAKLVGKKGEPVTAEELDCFEAYLTKAKMDLADARDGIELKTKDGGTQTLGGFEKSVMDALEARVDRMAADVARLRTDALDASIKKVYDEFPCDLLDAPVFSDAYIDKRCSEKKTLNRDRIKAAVGNFRRDLAELKTALDECRRSGDSEHARQVAERFYEADYTAALSTYIDYSGLPNDEAFRIKQRLPFLDFQGMERPDTQILPTLISRFRDMVKKAQKAKSANDREQLFVDKELLARVLDGRCGLSTAVSVGAWGADVKFLEEGVDDRNLVGCREFGKGAYNKVTQCTYRLKDGTTVRRVFKPELPALRGWTLPYATDKSIGKRGSFQQVALANVTSRKMAEILGAGNSIVDAHMGVHDGQFGLMMDVAEGVSGSALASMFESPPKNPEKVMVGEKSLKDLMDIFSSEDDGQARILLGNLRHALTNLEWVDHITGQTDRHASNYKISIGEDLSVRVVGFDNDMSFTEIVDMPQAYPTAISQGVYDRLKELDEALYDADGQPLPNATQILSQKLVEDNRPVHDLSDNQLKAMVTRIHKAFVAADSPDCEKIPDDGNWLNMSRLKPLYLDRRKNLDNEHLDRFSYHVIKSGMFPSNHSPFADLESDILKRNRRWGRRLQGILNDQEKVQHMIVRAKDGSPAVSEAELKAYFDLMAKDPTGAAVPLAGKMDDENSETVEEAIVQLGRDRKQALVDTLRDVKPSDDHSFENDPFVQRCIPQYFRLDREGTRKIGPHFARALAAVKGHEPPLAAQKLALLETGGALELAPFIGELLDEFKNSDDVDGGLIAEALVAELAKEETGEDLDEAEVGRLRRLVANKLRVKPEEVLSPRKAKKLTEDQLAAFKRACAITPSGKDYYAQVKANYEWLNG